MSKSAIYKFAGDGAGVPGLPHEVTKEQAEQLDVGKILARAIDDGVYVLAEADKSSAERLEKAKVKEKSDG